MLLHRSPGGVVGQHNLRVMQPASPNCPEMGWRRLGAAVPEGHTVAPLVEPTLVLHRRRLPSGV